MNRTWRKFMILFGVLVSCFMMSAAQAYYYPYRSHHYDRNYYYGPGYYGGSGVTVQFGSGYYKKTNCKWVGGHWYRGHWYPAQRVCYRR